jgi:N-acetylmuramoyl-L-alanine amidase-like protein
MKRSFLVAAVLAVAFPGAALGSGVVQRDLAPQAPSRAVSARVFELVGLHWRGPGSVKYRTRNLAGRWSAWRFFSDEDALPDRGPEARATWGWRVASPFWTGPSNGIQYRTVGRVFRLRAYFVRSPRQRSPVKRVHLADAPEIVPRVGWHADESIRRGGPYYADAVHLAIVHHTAGSNSYTRAQSASIVRAIELYHVKGNGWNDIGYNFLVDKYGQIFEGRYGGMTRPVVGAHAQGFNSGSVGISVIGDYGSTSITPAARAAVISLIAWRLDLAHVDPASRVVRVSAGNPRYPAGRAVTLRAISGHRDVYPTSCPGASLYAQLPSLRVAVAATGLPKLYSPTVVGTLGGPVRFQARLSGETDWRVTVRDESGAVVASGSGTGTSVDWTWDATAAVPGRYAWSIGGLGLRAASGTIGTAPAPLALKELKVTPAVVSPNGDGRDETATVSYALSAPAVVTATVEDTASGTVTTIFDGSRAAGKQSLVWGPGALPDGWYRLTLTAKAGKRQVQTTTGFWVDRTLAGFGTSAAAISPNGDGTFDTLELSFRLLAPAHVQVRIRRGGTDVGAPLLDADLAAGSQKLDWDGSGLPDGRYDAVVSVTDSLLTVRQSVAVWLDRKAPILRLVSLPRLLFRVDEPARVVLSVNGRWRKVTVKRAGLFHIGFRGRVRGLSAFAVDAAGNRGRTVSARR